MAVQVPGSQLVSALLGGHSCCGQRMGLGLRRVYWNDLPTFSFLVMDPWGLGSMPVS